jgi:hypothetical protein
MKNPNNNKILESLADKRKPVPKPSDGVHTVMEGVLAPDKYNGEIYERRIPKKSELYKDAKGTLRWKSNYKPVSQETLDAIKKHLDRKKFRKFCKFSSGIDDLYEVMGSALENNSKEVDDMIEDVESKGGKITPVSQRSAYYNPTSGKPGEIKIFEKASLGAWMHEYRHFLDDMESGWIFGDIVNIKDLNKRQNEFWKYEKRGFEEEIRVAKEYGHEDVIPAIEKQMEERRVEIMGDVIKEAKNTNVNDSRELIFSDNFMENIDGLLSVVKYGHTDKETLKQVVSFITGHKNSNKKDLFGFWVYDYALATLFRLNTKDSMEIYNKVTSKLEKGVIDKIECLQEKDWFDRV